MVGEHAAGAARRHVGAERMGTRQGRDLRPRHDHAGPSSPEEFTTTATYRVARSGETVTRTGRAIVYTGFQWRGRSSTRGGGLGAARSDDGRSQLAVDGGTLVHRRLRRARHRREARARRRRERACSAPIGPRSSKARPAQAAEDLRQSISATLCSRAISIWVRA